MQTGANISQVFLSASGFLHLYFFPRTFFSERAVDFFHLTSQTRIDEFFCFE